MVELDLVVRKEGQEGQTGVQADASVSDRGLLRDNYESLLMGETAECWCCHWNRKRTVCLERVGIGREAPGREWWWIQRWVEIRGLSANNCELLRRPQ